jgi:hypothetical protein
MDLRMVGGSADHDDNSGVAVVQGNWAPRCHLHTIYATHQAEILSVRGA